MGLRGKGKRNQFWTLRAAAGESGVGELLIYGEISDVSWWGDEVTPKQFNDDLKALGDIGELRVYINSGGGDAFAGQAIYSMLKRHSAEVIVYIDGLAASAASVIAMAGDVIRMPKNAMMMIHNPSTFGWGEASKFRRVADMLDQVRDSLIPAYEEKTGLERDQIIQLLNDETWLTAEEAVKLGFADEIEGSKQVAASLHGGELRMNGRTFDLSRFRSAPDVPEVKDDRQLRLLALEYELITGKSLEGAGVK